MEPHIFNSFYGIDNESLQSIVKDAKDYATYKGITFRSPEFSEDVRVFLPFCVVPSKFPLQWFCLARELQPVLNEILLSVSLSREFLQECLTGTIESDEFISNIFKIFKAVENLDKPEQYTLGLVRSDYLLNANSCGSIIGMKQVENNTFSSSFGGLSPSVRLLHEFVLERLGQKNFHQRLPENESDYDLARGLVAAWDVYDNESAIILFVVEKITYNISDQRALEYAILENEKNIKVMRYSFEELRDAATMKNDKLFVHNKEVAVVYYRTGYVPEDYEPEDWEVRFLMERSLAIKCPSAGLHLAGTKRVQMYLTREGVLERFVTPDVAAKLRLLFAKQYSLDMNPDGDRAVKLGLENPEDYVLKPEREGGGNNLYGDDVKKTLAEIQSSEKRKAYILMERICPPVFPNCIVQKDEIPEIKNVICELGTFGVILGKKTNIMKNYYAGHLLRSKRADSNETGVAAGFGALDSPYLE